MNKLAIITGGTKGIGRALIEKFAQNDFDIITCSRNEQDLKELKKHIEIVHPKIHIHYQKTDLVKKQETLAFAKFIRFQGRKIDVLINNAGSYVSGQLHLEKEDVLETMIELNLYSAYYLTKNLLPLLMKQKEGHIFNMCSIASILPYTEGASYCISKFAMYGFTKVLREELKNYGVKVTAVLPGATLTESWKGVDIPKEKFIQPRDIAESIFSAWSLTTHSTIEELIIRPQLGDI